MKCATNRNVSMNAKVSKAKTRTNTNSNSLLTNAANMKITKAIANSKQQQRKTANSKVSTAGNLNVTNADLLYSTSYERDQYHQTSHNVLARTDLKDMRVKENSFSEIKKESSLLPAATSAMAKNSLATVIKKETEGCGKEQRSPTQLNPYNVQTPKSPTPPQPPPSTQGVQQTLREHNTHNSNSSSNGNNNNSTGSENQQAVHNNNGQRTEFLRSAATNLNLSSLALKTPQLISVVNEQSNQTVLRTTLATSIPIPTTTTTTTTPSHNTNTNNPNNENLLKNCHEVLSNTTTTTKPINASEEDHSKSDYYQQTVKTFDKFENNNLKSELTECVTKASPQQKVLQNSNNNNTNTNNDEQQNSGGDNNSTTTSATGSISSNKTVINSVIITANANSNANNNNIHLNETAKEKSANFINGLTTTFTATSSSSSTSTSTSTPTSTIQSTTTPQNYRGLNNSVIITNYTNSHAHQTTNADAYHQQQLQTPQPSSAEYSGNSQNPNLLNAASNDPNLNLAVIGSTQHIEQQHHQQASPAANQLQHHLHTHSHSPHPHHIHQFAANEHWLNAYNPCAYDLSLNHPSSGTDSAAKEFINLQLLSSPLSQIPPPHTHPHHQHHHHHHHQTASPYYTTHLLNPSNTSNYLQDDHHSSCSAAMKSNLAFYSTGYVAPHHDHLQHHSLMGSQSITATTHHTPSSIDAVIEDTLKDECLEDHHSGVSYLTLNSVVDVQSLKDAYHSPGLGQDLTHLTAIAPAHLQTTSTPHHHLHAIHYIQPNNSTSSGGNSPSPTSALSQTGDMATLQSFTQLTNANGVSNRDIYNMLTGADQSQLFGYPSPPSPVLSNG